MNRATGFFFTGLLVLTLGSAAWEQEATPRSPAANASGPNAPADREWPQPGSVRLNLRPILFDSALQRDPYRIRPAEQSYGTDPRSVTRVKLFESGSLSAAVGNDGRIHYRLPAPGFLGTKFGGQISTNSAKLTLTWPPKD